MHIQQWCDLRAALIPFVPTQSHVRFTSLDSHKQCCGHLTVESLPPSPSATPSSPPSSLSYPPSPLPPPPLPPFSTLLPCVHDHCLQLHRRHDRNASPQLSPRRALTATTPATATARRLCPTVPASPSLPVRPRSMSLCTSVCDARM